MATKAKTGFDALRQTCKDDPCDLDARLVMADFLEEGGEVDAAHFERQLVAFARFVQSVAQKGRTTGKVRTGIMEGPRNIRIILDVSVEVGEYKNTSRTLYCWVVKGAAMDGVVMRGSWASPAPPKRFTLSEGPDVWAKHVGPYGLAYLR